MFLVKLLHQVKIPDGLDDQAISIFKEYLNLFCDLLEQANPVSGEKLEKIQSVFEDYFKSLIDHVPIVVAV